MSQPKNDGGGCDDNKGGSWAAFFAGLMKERSMSYPEILSHSLPFLETISNEINRIRIIEAGGDPDREDDEENKNGTDHSVPNNSSDESDPLFYGRLNEMLR